ncbi:MAG: glycosyltransferase, partial [Candidatus Gracilibacteria bacterium]
TGRGNIDIGAHNKGYKQFEYLNEGLKDIYKICDLVVTRGGSNSLFEIAALKKRAVVIPLSTSVSRGDQIDNAKIFMRKFGWGVLAGNISREEFINTINLSINNQLKIKDVEVLNGASTISDIILKQGK